MTQDNNALAQELEALNVTKGEWLIAEEGFDFPQLVRLARKEDAEFVNLCANNRDTILAALRQPAPAAGEVGELVKRLRGIDHMNVEECFMDSHLFAKAADMLERLAGTVQPQDQMERVAEAIDQWIGDISTSREIARAAIAAMPSGEVRQWLPIDSAPKDGASVLLFSPDASDQGIMVGGHATFNDGSECWHDPVSDSVIDAWPTHWMPLPAPPAALDGEG